MNPKDPKNIIPAKGNFIEELALNGRLILRLIGDRRVNVLLKAIPFASLIYLVNPIDLPTPLDDFTVIGLALYLFIELCPPEVVDEHRNRLRGIEPGAESYAEDHPDVVEGEFHPVEDVADKPKE